MNHSSRQRVIARVLRHSCPALALILVAACRGPAALPDYLFELDGKPVQAEFAAVEGDGERPVPGDVLSRLPLSHYPLLVLDDVEEQSFEEASGGRIYRRAGGASQLVSIEVAEANDLASLSDAEAAGLRGIEFARWNAAVARELVRVDARRCLFRFGPLSDAVDLADLPTTTRYLHMHYAEPVDPAGFVRFSELRYLVVPAEAWIHLDHDLPPPPPPPRGSPEPAIAVDWVRRLPELRWLDLEGVGSDLRPLAGHPRLRTVRAAHCVITELPAEVMPALREFVAPFSDCTKAQVERLRRRHPTARISTTSREVLLDCIRTATRLQLRTGASCHPKPSDRVVYTTEDRSEIGALFDLLRPKAGYVGSCLIPGCDAGVMQFFGPENVLLAEVGVIGTGTLRCDQAWSLDTAYLGSKAKASALRAWLAVRGLDLLGQGR